MRSLIINFKTNYFAIQLDKATNININAHLICYVRFMNRIDVIKESFYKSILEGNKARTYLELLIISLSIILNGITV